MRLIERAAARRVHQVIDAWERRSWATIFIWSGANAIALYFINGIVGFQPLATQLVGGDMGSCAFFWSSLL